MGYTTLLFSIGSYCCLCLCVVSKNSFVVNSLLEICRDNTL